MPLDDLFSPADLLDDSSDDLFPDTTGGSSSFDFFAAFDQQKVQDEASNTQLINDMIRRAEEKKKADEDASTFIGGIKRDIQETWKDPLYALPAVLETAGTIAGTLLPAPVVGPVVAGMLGRSIGETIYSVVRDKPLFTAQNAYELMSGALLQMGTSYGATVAKRAISGPSKRTVESLVKPLTEPVPLPKDVEGVLKLSHAEAFMKREMAFFRTPIEEIKKIRAGLLMEKEPPVPEGMTRLYRAIPPKVEGEETTKLGLKKIAGKVADPYIPPTMAAEAMIVKPASVGKELLHALPEGATKAVKAADIENRIAATVKQQATHEKLYEAAEAKASGVAAYKELTGDVSRPPGKTLDVGPTTGFPTEQGVFFSRQRELAEELMEKDTAGRPYGRIAYLDVPKDQVGKWEEMTTPRFENVNKYLMVDKSTASKAAIHKITNLSEAEAAIDKQVKIRDSFMKELNDLSQAKSQEWVQLFGGNLQKAQMYSYIDKPVLNDLERQGKGVGLLPSVWNPHVVLTEAGVPHISTLGDITVTTSENMKAFLGTKLKTLVGKYGVLTDADIDAAKYLHYNPDHADSILKGTFKSVKGVSDESLIKVAKLSQETRETINGGLYALQRKINPDPEKLALWNSKYVNTTSSTHQALDDLQARFARNTAMLADMSEDELASEFGKLLQRDNRALERSISVFTEATKKASVAMQIAREHFEQFGTIPGKKLGAQLSKDWDLAFGSNYFGILNDYANAAVDKIVSDATMPGFRHMISAIENPATREYASKYVMALGGSQKMAQLSSLSGKLGSSNLIPKAAREYLGDPTHIANAYEGINQWVYAVGIGLNPRFVPLNLMQHLITTKHVVGDEALSFGINSTVREVGKMLAAGTVDGSSVLARAIAQGAIRPEAITAISEAGTLVQEGAVKKAITAIPYYSELVNRLTAFQAGEYAGKAAGLTGTKLADYAKEVVRLTQYDYSVASRPLISATATGSLLFRFKSFGIQYGHMLKHLLKTGKHKEFADAIASVIAIGGTAGIPGYDLIRGGAAAAGVYLPEIDPIHQMTGFSLGGSVMPFPVMPTDVTSALGPVFGPASQIVSGVMTADPFLAGVGAQRLGMGAAAKAVQGVSELTRGGKTYSPKGNRLYVERGTGDIVKSMAGLEKQPRQLRGTFARNLELAYKAKDARAVGDIKKEAYRRGVRDLKRLSGQAKARISRDENESAIGILLGL